MFRTNAEKLRDKEETPFIILKLKFNELKLTKWENFHPV